MVHDQQGWASGGDMLCPSNGWMHNYTKANRTEQPIAHELPPPAIVSLLLNNIGLRGYGYVGTHNFFIYLGGGDGVQYGKMDAMDAPHPKNGGLVAGLPV